MNQAEEELFCQQIIEKTAKKEEKKPPKEISILDGKTSMNVNIFLRQFKGGGDEVLKWICEGKSKELEGDRLKCLEKLLPDAGVIDELKSFTGKAIANISIIASTFL